MSTSTAGGRQDDNDGASWATESLPMAVRKELLERELHKLGFRRAAAAQQQQQPQGQGGSHPQADGNGDAGTHAD